MKKLLIITMLSLLFLGCKKEPATVQFKIDIAGRDMNIKINSMGSSKTYFNGGGSDGSSITVSAPKGKVVANLSTTSSNGARAKFYNSHGGLIREIVVLYGENVSQGIEIE